LRSVAAVEPSQERGDMAPTNGWRGTTHRSPVARDGLICAIRHNYYPPRITRRISLDLKITWIRHADLSRDDLALAV